jgi:predicted amidohydrolase
VNDTLTVAAVQAYAVPNDIGANAARAAALVSEAADQGAELVVLPELFLCGYYLDLDLADTGPDDARLDPLRDVARDRSAVVVVGGSVRRPDGARSCSALVVDRTGEVREAYRKQNLCGPDERALFAAGDHGATLHLDGWRFGIGICYDGCFPEHARAAQADEVHGMVYPAAYPRGSEHRRDIYYAARALDNTSYVVFANPVGGHGTWWFNGGAAVFDPEGRTLAKGPNDGESVQVATLRLDDLEGTRSRHRMLVDRPRFDEGRRQRLDT